MFPNKKTTTKRSISHEHCTQGAHVTEEMKYRRRLCEYAVKYGVTKAARRYHTYRHFVYRQLEKYDGNVRSFASRSRRPQHSPNAHTKEELELIRRMLKMSGVYGLAEVYVRCRGKERYNNTAKYCLGVKAWIR